MKKRLLPIPLILLIPIVLLIVVVVAGVYRFSLSDDEILAKFSQQKMEYDPIIAAVFGIQSPNPWTIEVPETNAFAFIDSIDEQHHWASGPYDAGAERGQLLVSTQWLTSIDTHQYASVLALSNQGSGVFYYLASFYYDKQRKRMILVDQQLLGDRINLSSLTYENNQLRVRYLTHAEQQAMTATPTKVETREFSLKSNLMLVPLPR